MVIHLQGPENSFHKLKWVRTYKLYQQWNPALSPTINQLLNLIILRLKWECLWNQKTTVELSQTAIRPVQDIKIEIIRGKLLSSVCKWLQSSCSLPWPRAFRWAASFKELGLSPPSVVSAFLLWCAFWVPLIPGKCICLCTSWPYAGSTVTSSVDVISLTSVFLHQGPDERPGPTGAGTLIPGQGWWGWKS